MLKIRQRIFPIFLFFILFLEGSGIGVGRDIALYLTIISPAFFFLLNSKKIHVPKQVGILGGAFLLTSIISTLFSYDLSRSVPYVLFLSSSFLLMLYAYNNKEEIGKYMPLTIYTLAGIFSFLFFIKQVLNITLLSQFTTNGNQLTYPFFYSHNHLGDFLILPVVLLVYSISTQKIPLIKAISILAALVFILFSYSRSAYIALTAALIFIMLPAIKQTKKQRVKFLIPFILLFIVFSFFILTSAMESKPIPFINTARQILVQKSGLFAYKTLLSDRPEYMRQGLKSIANHPFFGVGGANFFYASRETTKNPITQIVLTSHNIFIDMLVELGVIAGGLFIAFVIMLFLRSEKKLFLVLATALLINFQTDYTFQIYSFFLLFLLLLALSYKEKEIILNPLAGFLTGSIPAFCAIIILVSFFLSFGHQYKASVAIYPFNREAYFPLISSETKQGNKNSVINYSDKQISAFPNDAQVLIFAGDVFSQINEEKKALFLYEKGFKLDPYRYPPLIRGIFLMKKKFEGEESAKKFILDIFHRVDLLEHTWYVPSIFFTSLNNVCTEANMNCPLVRH